MSKHLIELGSIQSTDSRSPITTNLRVTDEDGKVIGDYFFNEHDYVRLLRGGVVQVTNDAPVLS